MTAALAVLPLDAAESLPELIDRAARALTEARTSAEIEEAGSLAEFSLKTAQEAGDLELCARAARVSADAAQLRLSIFQGRKAIPAKVKQEVLAEAEDRCMFCGRWCEPLEVDHLRPVCLGGNNHPENLIAVCQTCNRRKGRLPFIEFLARERIRRRQEAEQFISAADVLDQLYSAVTGEAAQ